MSSAASERQNAAILASGRETPLGYWLFRNRSWLPVPLLLAMIVLQPRAVDPTRVVVGAVCIVAGEVLRLWAVRHIGVVSRTRTMSVGPLITSGPYALTRNPLYVANFLLWTGFALASSLDWMLPLSWAVFALQHATVVRWEEQLLASRYPSTYPGYARVVPRWWPRVATVRVPSSAPHPWGEVLFSERGTLVALVVISVLLVAKEMVR